MAPGTSLVDIDDGSGPRKQTRRRGFATRRAAQAALSTTLHDPSRKTYVAPSRQTLAVFAQQEWLPAIEPTVRPSTYDSYARNIRLNVVEHAIGLTLLQQVDAPRLNRFYADLLAGRDE